MILNSRENLPCCSSPFYISGILLLFLTQCASYTTFFLIQNQFLHEEFLFIFLRNDRVCNEIKNSELGLEEI